MRDRLRLGVLAWLAAAALLGGCRLNVPNVKPAPPEGLAAHAPVVVISVIIVIVVDALVLWATVRRRSE